MADLTPIELEAIKKLIYDRKYQEALQKYNGLSTEKLIDLIKVKEDRKKLGGKETSSKKVSKKTSSKKTSRKTNKVQA